MLSQKLLTLTRYLDSVPDTLYVKYEKTGDSNNTSFVFSDTYRNNYITNSDSKDTLSNKK